MANNSKLPTYYGNNIDIQNAKNAGLQGKFYDISKYGEKSILTDISNAFKSGANPIILGGAGAVGGINDKIQNQLKQSGVNINRIGGADRYEVLNNAKRFDDQNRINSLYDQQQKNVAPQFAQQRNQADAVNQQNVQKLREAMAANGLTGSGENVTAQVGLGAARQNSLNNINAQETQMANALESQRIQELMNSRKYWDEINYRDNRDRVEDQRYNQEKSWREKTYNDEKAWREYTYKNMSASEKATLDWARTQYGEDAAWRMFQLQYQGELAKSQSQAELDFYKNSGFLVP
ncbi:hypothetical protein [Cytobacillus sp. FSL H8-0458]|uniref:hypothetical protein n=1 Tax=Cytobacillus sp. FSL H8-0458 TaxID=2975346 RepID=UPI0030F829CA